MKSSLPIMITLAVLVLAPVSLTQAQPDKDEEDGKGHKEEKFRNKGGPDHKGGDPRHKDGGKDVGGRFGITIHAREAPSKPRRFDRLYEPRKPEKPDHGPSAFDIFRKMAKPPWTVEPPPVHYFREPPPPPKYEAHAMLDFAGTYFPYSAAQLNVWRTHRPDVYTTRLHELELTIREFSELRERSPERARLFLRARSLEDRSRQLADAIVYSRSGRDRMKLQRELRDVLGQAFDVQLELRRIEIEDLEREIIQLRSSIDRRHRNRNRIVDRRFSELLDEAGETVIEEDVNLDWW